MPRIFVLLFLATGAFASLPPLDVSLDTARASTEGGTLRVSTGAFERIWRLTPNGLRTLALGSRFGVPETTDESVAAGADWEAEGWIGGTADARLVALEAHPSTDHGFTTPHLEVTAEFEYPASRTALRYVIWAYPGADGLRTQLWLKSLDPGRDPAGPTLPAFSVLKGRPADGAIVLAHPRELVLKVGPLDPALAYTLEFETSDRTANPPSITLTSIDNETRIPVNPSGDSDPARADVPLAVRPNGEVTIRVATGRQGQPARLSAARLLSAGETVATLDIASSAARSTDRTPPTTQRSHQADLLPVRAPILRAIGYFNDTQNRHKPGTHLLREEAVPPGRIDWASILCLESPKDVSLALVKESHKCVNQSGVDTGAFLADRNGVALTGFGLSRNDLRSDEWCWAWANWIIAYPSAPDATGRDEQRELALKRFQRVRYPVRADLDLYLKANTWGSGTKSGESIQRASEREVLAELGSVADLGLDTLQIDDGWQKGRMPGPTPRAEEWEPRPDWYPEGWTRVVAAAREKHVDLGIWHAARAPLDALKANFDRAGFKTWKLDFANLSTYAGAREYLDKGRAHVEHSDHSIRVNWDVTEIQPRFGYFWASECGNLWLANRKPAQPASVVPRPWLMLRETREIARYLNLNKVELPIQNFRMVNREVSDAWQHDDAYSVALGLPGIPVFFQTTRLLADDQRAAIKPLLETYKAHRLALFRSYVFPVGDEPDNASWSGFQWHDPDRPDDGYLLVFRERENDSPNHDLRLRFTPAGSPLELTDLRTGVNRTIRVSEQCTVPLELPNAPDFLFLRFHLP